MKKKPQGYKKGGSVRSTSKTAKPAGKKVPPFGKRPKAKIPSLGSGMVGLGGTGAQGMMP